MNAPRTAVLFPGFTRQPSDVALFATECEECGWTVLAQSLAPRGLPFLYMVPSRLRRIARTIALDSPNVPLVLVGHSAGASAACYLAERLIELGSGVRGVVLVDGVDSPNHLIRRSLPGLRARRVAAVLAPPSPCNKGGLLERSLASYPWVRREVVAGAGHGDIEGDGIGIYRRMCKDTSTPEVAREFRRAVLASMMWVLNGEPEPVRGE